MNYWLLKSEPDAFSDLFDRFEGRDRFLRSDYDFLSTIADSVATIVEILIRETDALAGESGPTQSR